ncbi:MULTISPECIES: SDR family NAD(P)-dependent oxidoreductase [Bifidobacterium]|jgi:NADP-dependent 3-hydroxy acid dehydrogenase YdfG|uniref:SDR family NAD(P)-dependent oxidoreductase n=1 Tax=Bifidobacterium tibiigranuli TaxID=2172043 RepID=A0A5N6S0T1_9BIFI|nr:SDR family NAD(P)-dependent oxidoreductase [Bifidobacterium tibiigranuli]KAE8127053.1 SDR family NAD(P)-dependent oxidoreductase [Bifidobacterium tibiigranuli]KAE8127750.1 SDR family NAD(P)-dependent oxidoreductase [Bifidobacterium tibiigranuli]MCH3973861.1 SDR family oxidoreductase [Bifidobacterium tibiigranuli]MCH4189359.1 SDR family oxidoreductase [Bifidobacterium tibiigranuli]MCH4203856.1 SDR family oxidoreductase [Bifidobacterium tibiigranuli]
MANGIAIVTGCAAGLGYELTRQLIGKGWLVCGVDFNEAAMRKLNAEFDGEFDADHFHGFVGDITDEDFAQRSLAQISALGHVDLLINNAGQPSFKKPTDYTASDVERCLKGLTGMILWCVQTLKACNETDLKIANVMSTAATRGNANESVYCAAKWGERGYTESLKAAYKGSSVSVVGVYPGGIDTDFYRDSHDYVPLDKQHSFMRADELATIILTNLVNDLNLTVSDIRIDRNPR